MNVARTIYFIRSAAHRPPIGERSIVMSVSLCVFVCPRSHLRNYTSVLHQIFHARYLWPWLGPPLAAYWYVTYFRYMDDVILAHKPILLDVAARLRQWGSGLARRYTRCRQRTLGTTSCSQCLLGRIGRVECLCHHACTSCPCVYSDNKNAVRLK